MQLSVADKRLLREVFNLAQKGVDQWFRHAVYMYDGKQEEKSLAFQKDMNELKKNLLGDK